MVPVVSANATSFTRSQPLQACRWRAIRPNHAPLSRRQTPPPTTVGEQMPVLTSLDIVVGGTGAAAVKKGRAGTLVGLEVWGTTVLAETAKSEVHGGIGFRERTPSHIIMILELQIILHVQ